MRGGLGLSFVIGFLSSILGIGGGIIHVPAMVFLVDFSAHLATATSHFVLAITSPVGSVGNVAAGRILYIPAIAMSVGAIGGARLGAQLSRRVQGALIVRVLSLALVVVGLRLLYVAIGGSGSVKVVCGQPRIEIRAKGLRPRNPPPRVKSVRGALLVC